MKKKNLKPIEIKEKPYICPFCGGEEFDNYVYGLMDNFKTKDNVIFGGCIVTEDSPDYRCKNCRQTFVIKV